MSTQIANRFLFLDFARAISALAVCVGHLRAVLFVDFADATNRSLGTKLFYFGTGLGHQAVIVFFVLSGYLVGGAILKRGDEFRVTDYAASRLIRLWMVLIPALLFTFSIDCLTEFATENAIHGENHDLWRSGPNGDYSLSLTTLIGNICFVQTILVPVFGTNSPLWSLCNEFWYYVFFPIMFFAGKSLWQGNPIKSLILAMLFIALGYFFLVPIWLGFFIWIFGVIAWLCHKYCTPSNSPFWLVLAGSLFFGSLVYSKSSWPQQLNIEPDLVIGVAFSLLLISIQPTIVAANRVHSITERLAVGLSEMSYTLYLTHFPIVILMGALIFKEQQLNLSIYSISLYLLIIVALLVVSWIFWWCFESRTPAVRSAANRLFTVFR